MSTTSRLTFFFVFVFCALFSQSSRTLVDQAGRDFITLLSSSSSSNRFAPELRQPLVDLWNDDGIKLAWKRGKERCFPENLPYLMDAQNMERFWREGYLPSSQVSLGVETRRGGRDGSS